MAFRKSEAGQDPLFIPRPPVNLDESDEQHYASILRKISLRREPELAKSPLLRAKADRPRPVCEKSKEVVRSFFELQPQKGAILSDRPIEDCLKRKASERISQVSARQLRFSSGSLSAVNQQEEAWTFVSSLSREKLTDLIARLKECLLRRSEKEVRSRRQCLSFP